MCCALFLSEIIQGITWVFLWTSKRLTSTSVYEKKNMTFLATLYRTSYIFIEWPLLGPHSLRRGGPGLVDAEIFSFFALVGPCGPAVRG